MYPGFVPVNRVIWPVSEVNDKTTLPQPEVKRRGNMATSFSMARSAAAVGALPAPAPAKVPSSLTLPLSQRIAIMVNLLNGCNEKNRSTTFLNLMSLIFKFKGSEYGEMKQAILDAKEINIASIKLICKELDGVGETEGVVYDFIQFLHYISKLQKETPDPASTPTPQAML